MAEYEASDVEQEYHTERQGTSQEQSSASSSSSSGKSWWGKVAGGVIGFAVGGPVGAVIGAGLGHGVDHLASESQTNSGPGYSPSSGSSPHPFEVQVAGVTYSNDDGSSRQHVVSMCHVDEHLLLIRDPGNQYDGNAIKVCRTTGAQLGFIPASVAANLAPLMDSGMKFTVIVENVVGGDGYNYGCTVRII